MVMTWKNTGRIFKTNLQHKLINITEIINLQGILCMSKVMYINIKESMEWEVSLFSIITIIQILLITSYNKWSHHLVISTTHSLILFLKICSRHLNKHQVLITYWQCTVMILWCKGLLFHKQTLFFTLWRHIPLKCPAFLSRKTPTYLWESI